MASHPVREPLMVSGNLRLDQDQHIVIEGISSLAAWPPTDPCIPASMQSGMQRLVVRKTGNPEASFF
jgi:hypothetical protein